MSFSESGGLITQTGTDTDLSGLQGVSGVIVVNNGSHKTYHLDNVGLRINGTLTIDPQVECLLFEQQDLDIFGTLNFGVTTVIGGATRYSRAIGLISYESYSNGYLKFFVQSGGTLNWNGGAMKLRGGCDFKDGSNVSITNGIIIATNSTKGQRLRMNTANCSVDGLSIDGNLRFDVFKKFVSFNRYNSSFTETGTIQKVGSTHNGTDDPFVLTNFDAQGIQSLNGDFIGSSYRGTKIEFVNMGFTGDFNISHDSTGGETAVTTLYKDIKLKIVDTNISSIEGAKYWATDKDNGSRFSGTASWLGSQNADETFSSDRVYAGSTDSNGEATTRLLTRACYGGESPLGVYDGNTTIDYRGATTDNTDVFNFYVASYGHTLNTTSPSCIGTGVLEQQVVLFNDVFLTEFTKSVVDDYQEIDTPQKLYDKAKAFLVDHYAGEISTIVARSGNEIDLGSYNLIINPNASDPFSFNGTTITIKTDTFVGDLKTTGLITLQGIASVAGRYEDQTGVYLLLPWSIANIQAGSTIQLFNVTKNTHVVTKTVSGTGLVTENGSFNADTIDVNDYVRLRITYALGKTALLPFEAFAVATTAGFGFIVEQKPDTVYNLNNIDGSSITTLNADYSNVQIDIPGGGGFADTRELYAFAVYQATTTEGIAKWFNAITAIDEMNYRVNVDVVDLRIQNRGSGPLVITGARLYRSDGTSVLFAESGDQPMTQDTGELLQYIEAQVKSSLDNNQRLSSIDGNTKLIPGLF